MSVAATTAVWERSRAKGSSLLLMLALADYANEDHEAWPSVARLVAMTRMSERNIQYGLRRLTDDGELEVVEPGGRRNGKGYATRYRLSGCFGAKSAPKDDGCKVDGCKPASNMGANQRTSRVQPAAPQPSVEPSEEPPPPKKKSARATSADRNKVPDDFPDGLRPHARIVLKLLREVAADHNARDVSALALSRTMMRQPRKGFVKEAYSLASWAVDPPRPIKDVLGTYRTWLDKSVDLADIERLDGTGHPVNGNRNSNGNGLAQHGGRRYGGGRLTPQELHERAERLRAEGS
jgi:hypothetical protein